MTNERVKAVRSSSGNPEKWLIPLMTVNILRSRLFLEEIPSEPILKALS